MIRSIIFGLYLLATAWAAIDVYDIPRRSVDGFWYMNYASVGQKVDACGVLNTMDYCKCIIVDHYHYDRRNGLDRAWVSVIRGFNTKKNIYELTLWETSIVPSDEEKGLYKVNYWPGQTFYYMIVGSDRYDNWVAIITDKTIDPQEGNSTSAGWIFSRKPEMDPTYKAAALETISQQIDLDPATLIKIDQSNCPPILIP